VIEDQRRIVIQAPSPSLRFIDFHIKVIPVVDVKIEKTNHSLFAARVEPHLAPAGNSALRQNKLVNAEGLESEKGTFGKKSAWCDFSGDNGWGTEGIAIFDHPANRWFPSEWFTRDYGFMSPTPLNWLGPEGLSLPKGQPLELHYRMVAHGGASWQADLAGLFAKWKEEKF